MMDMRGPTKSDHETLRTNANFISRFPETIIERGGPVDPLASSEAQRNPPTFTDQDTPVKFPDSIKIATAYSSLLAPGLQRRRESVSQSGSTRQFEGYFHADALPRHERALYRSQTLSLSRKSVSAFQPVSRLSLFS